MYIFKTQKHHRAVYLLLDGVFSYIEAQQKAQRFVPTTKPNKRLVGAVAPAAHFLLEDFHVFRQGWETLPYK